MGRPVESFDPNEGMPEEQGPEAVFIASADGAGMLKGDVYMDSAVPGTPVLVGGPTKAAEVAAGMGAGGAVVSIGNFVDGDTIPSATAAAVVWNGPASVSSSITIEMETPTTQGTRRTIQDISGTLGNSRRIYITTEGSERINGDTSINIRRAYSALVMTWTGSMWVAQEMRTP